MLNKSKKSVKLETTKIKFSEIFESFYLFLPYCARKEPAPSQKFSFHYSSPNIATILTFSISVTNLRLKTESIIIDNHLIQIETKSLIM